MMSNGSGMEMMGPNGMMMRQGMGPGPPGMPGMGGMGPRPGQGHPGMMQGGPGNGMMGHGPMGQMMGPGHPGMQHGAMGSRPPPPEYGMSQQVMSEKYFTASERFRHSAMSHLTFCLYINQICRVDRTCLMV